MPLSRKHQKFVTHYLAHGNAAEAARAAGYSAGTAWTQGWRLLNRQDVADAVREGQLAQRPGPAPVTSDRVIEEIAKVAFANVGDYMRFQPDGSAWVDLSSMTPEQAAAIAEITVEEFPDRSTPEKREVRRVKVKFHSKKDAFDQLMRHFGAYQDKLQLTLNDTELADIRAGRERLAAAREEAVMEGDRD